MFSNIRNFLKTKEQSQLEIEIKSITTLIETCENTLILLDSKNMETDDLDDIKTIVINFKTNYDEFIKNYQKSKIKNKIDYYNKVKNLKDSFDILEEKFIIRYLNKFATSLNGGVVLKTNKLKEGFFYYTFGEKYELKTLGIFVSKTSNNSNEVHDIAYNTFRLNDKKFDSINDKIDMYDTEKYYIEVKPEEDITLKKTPGGKPRRTHRRKNKKRRSSKQQKSKK